LAFSRSRTRFAEKYLNPADRFQEVLCGLIMVLDFTLIGGLAAGEGKHGVRHLLIAALGCNLAWGVIDGALYVMGALTGRRQRLRFLSDVRNAPNESVAFSAISGQLDPLLEPVTSAEERTRIIRAMLPVVSRIELPEAGITKHDFYGMAAIFWIDLASVIPAIIPFLIFGLLIASLFAAGFMWGRFAGVNRYLAGGCAMLVGLTLVGVAIALGG
jgi:hypothetical protein